MKKDAVNGSAFSMFFRYAFSAVNCPPTRPMETVSPS
jgi:hypothetical protein